MAAAYVGLLAYWLPKGQFRAYERTASAVDAGVVADADETPERLQTAEVQERTVDID